MLDSGSRPVRPISWKWVIATFSILLAYILIRNGIYLGQGMLRPNFGLMHKAYDFNFMELPLTVLLVAILLSLIALLWRVNKKILFTIAVLFAFFAADLFLLRYYVTDVEPKRLIVRQVRLETAKLAAPVRILHISDIQSGAITGYEEKVFAQIRELSPDLVLNTGDFLQVVAPATFESEFPKLSKLIQSVDPKFGTYAVFGDTEKELHLIDPGELLPLQFLSSRALQIDTGRGIIDLYGLSLHDSRNWGWAVRAVDGWTETLERDGFRILLGHAPDFALGMKDKQVDLCLAGHTHGGQVRLPWYGPLVVDSEVPRDWSRGFRRIGIPYLNVSAGAGSNRYGGLPPIRFNCPTEMTLIELVPSGSLIQR